MSRAGFLEVLAHPLFFETIDRLPVQEDDFLVPVRKLLRGDWTIQRRSVWFNCTPPAGRARDLPLQGWKIHVSSSRNKGLDILRAIVPVLDATDTSFKFALDERVLGLMNGKSWDRQGAGKFVTIYPTNINEFRSLLRNLDQVTRTFEGLYILSDKRYKDSKVLFYRYGGIRPLTRSNEEGERVSLLVSPSGEEVEDVRKPYFHLPPWVRDPFDEDVDLAPDHRDDEGRIALKGGRYLVKGVLGFKNSGGIYVADDVDNQEEVLIKEARPFVTFGSDAVTLLQKEHRLLCRVEDLGVAPRPIDYFCDWEHQFLVQELIRGVQLRAFSAAHNVTLRTSPTQDDVQEWLVKFKMIFRQLAMVLSSLHSRNIVFADLSPGNVLVIEESLETRLVDFEASYEVGVDEPERLFTLGFAHGAQMYGDIPHFESDYFGLGALMCHLLAPFNEILGISPRSRFTFLESVVADLGFPRPIHDTIVALIDNAADERPRPGQVIEVLERDYQLEPPDFRVAGPSAVSSYEEDIDRICQYCLALADPDRSDRLFPAYGAVFHTNPLSLAYGACGVAHAFQAMGRSVPDQIIDWILKPVENKDEYPPGLYTGLAGIAWAVLDLGRVKTAKRMLALCHSHPLRERTFDLFSGAAGWGLANLKFFLTLQDEFYLTNALEAGELLSRAGQTSGESLFWKVGEEVALGLGHGSSGIGLFLLYLYAASQREEFMDAGRRALDYDLKSGVETRDGGLSWRRFDNDHPILYPYWRYGSAGVAAALARYQWVLGEENYSHYIDAIFKDLNRKYAVYPGLFLGLAGIGEALLDLHIYTEQERFKEAAYKVATGIQLFKIERPEGLAFPGDGLIRICCDLATGSAGVGRYFHRLVQGGPSPLLLDELIYNG